MRNDRDQAGFTLVELMVTVLVGSLITLAATTVLLLGMRINKQSIGTYERQNTTRVLLSALEDLATEGTIKKVVSGPDAWQVLDDEGKVIFSYVSDSDASADQATGTIYSGGNPLLENVIASFISLDEQKLLTISVETEDGSYTSSVYCRTVPDMASTDDVGDNVIGSLAPPGGETGGGESTDGRTLFLRELAGQYKAAGGSVNRGIILDDDRRSTGRYFTEWYSGSDWQTNGWNKDTPWCACFISWGLNQVSDQVASPENRSRTDAAGETEYIWFSNVDYFMAYLKNNADGNEWKNSRYYEGNYTPQAGDLNFFDWTLNAQRNPEHIGAVLTVEGDYVYTIEGNSANMVAVRKYLLGDPRILGYGVLNWKAA